MKVNLVLLCLIFLTVSGMAADLFNENALSDQPLVTNVFYETDVRQALQDISAQIHVPIVMDPKVEGFINVELKNVPLDQALTMILEPLGYTYQKMDNYYIVGLAKPESPVFNLLAKTEVVNLDYVKAKDIKDLVSDFFLPYIKANVQNNSVAITAPQNIIDRFKDDIRKIDKPRQQVMMEALVVEITESAKKELGMRWGSMQEGGFIMSPPSGFTFNDFLKSSAATPSSNQLQFTGTVTQSTLFALKTMIQNGKAVVRANPRISALDGEEASIFIGREEFFLINTGSQAFPYNTLQSIGTGVTLKITPSVSSAGAITVKIQPEVSEVTGTGVANLPIVNRRSVSTTVRVTDGQTIAIGGLVQHSTTDTKTKAPVLGSIPLVGNLFKNNDATSEDKEVLIFITPHLADINKMFKQYSASDTNQGARELFKPVSYRAPSSYGYVRPSTRVIYQANPYDSQESYLIEKYSDYVNDILAKPDITDLVASLYDRDVTNPEVVVNITVSRSGYIDDVTIARSSGSQLLDSTLRDALLSAGPLPKFPSGLRQSSLTMAVTFRLG